MTDLRALTQAARRLCDAIDAGQDASDACTAAIQNASGELDRVMAEIAVTARQPVVVPPPAFANVAPIRTDGEYSVHRDHHKWSNSWRGGA